MLTEEYKDCLAYIDEYWERLIRLPNSNNVRNGFIPLPYPYIIPNDKFFAHLFYWDSYFMFRGLIGTDRANIMKFVVDDLIYLYKKYNVIPNFNNHSAVNRSQPPFLSSMILDVYNSTHNKKWLQSRMETAKLEYMHVWNDLENAYNHSVSDSVLSKYGDRDVGYSHTAELESGWDFTSRFYNRCSDFLPIDLNSYLYKYELDFMRVAQLFKDIREMHLWEKKAAERKEQMEKLMWNEKEGFFFDYDYGLHEKSKFFSLAGFIPLWVGFADAHQAAKMVLRLPLFETKSGLAITADTSLPADVIEASNLPEEYKKFFESGLKPKQWDYPNIWPPVEYLAVIGLLRYGYIDDAKRIMKKSLRAQASIFEKYHTFFEKINGVKGDRTGDYQYQNQSGFGWTNAVFYRYVQILSAMETTGDDSIYEFPMPDKPPYELGIRY